MSDEHSHVQDSAEDQPEASQARAAKKITFTQFAQCFPEVELPVLINNELLILASQKNPPLHEGLVQHFIYPGNIADDSEFTEYIPCFRIPGTENFHAMVYWRAELLDYQFILITFTKKGEEIARQALCGVVSDGDTLVQSVATFEADWSIIVVSGHTNAQNTTQFDAAQSTGLEFELLPDGTILKT